MAEEKEYGLLIAAIVAIVSIVGLVILFSRGAPVGKVVAGGPFPALPEMEKGGLAQECRDVNGELWCKSGGMYKAQPEDYGYYAPSEIGSDRASWS